jgi:hypothetical protein
MLSKAILEDLLKDCSCDSGKWCFFRDKFVSGDIGDRDAEQIRLVYDYRLMQSKKEGQDIGRKRASMEFTEKYAARFAEVYKEGMVRKDLFPLVFGIEFPMSTDEELEYHLKY